MRNCQKDFFTVLDELYNEWITEQDSVAGLSRLGKFLKVELLTIIDQ